MSKRRVVVTGLGVVSSIGIGIEEFSANLFAAKCGIVTITTFDCSELPVHIAGEVKGFDPEKWLSPKEVRHLDRFVQFALVAADEAVKSSGLDISKEDPYRLGCLWASGIGGLNEIERTHRMALEKGPRKINPFFIPKLMVNAGAGQIAIRLGLQGPNYAAASACASGNHALGLALRTIQYGDADVMVCGGSEATVTMLGIGGFCALKALSERNDDPKTASRPFNLDRDGFVVGEGAGALVFEEYERARARGARIYAEMKGFGMTDDAFHISAPVPEGTAAAQAMRLAVKDGGIELADVDYVNAHGTSTPLNDVMETNALRLVFGEHSRKIAVSSTKSQIGHLLGASGAVEGVVTVLAIDRQIAPPTINQITPDPACDLDYVPNQARPMRIRNAISNSFGFGGHNTSVLFGHME